MISKRKQADALLSAQSAVLMLSAVTKIQRTQESTLVKRVTSGPDAKSLLETHI
jgi:hypothetical protein